MSAQRPARPRRANPGLIDVDPGTLLLLGGGLWLLTSEAGRGLLAGFGLGGLTGSTPSEGAGTATGEAPGRPGSARVPSRTEFRITAVDPPAAVSLPIPGLGNVVPGVATGVPAQFYVTVSHLGPAGQYVVGIDIAPMHPLCPLGLGHNTPTQTFDADLYAADDGDFTEYTVLVVGTPNVGFGAADVRAFVRDTAGRQLVQSWFCASLWTVG